MNSYLKRILASSLIVFGLGGVLLPAAAQSGNEPAQGEIRKIDKETSKITLKHGEIKSLDMPPMTMVFQVKDPTLIDKFKVGDKVLFRVVKEGRTYVLTEIIPQ